MTGQSRGKRMAGWALSGLAAAGLLTGAAALALAADRPPPVLILDLGQSPPAAPSIAAIAEAAPQVTEMAPPTPDAPAPGNEATALPETVPAPDPARSAALHLPKVDGPAVADLALPPPPEKPAPPEKPKTVEKPVEKAPPKPERPKTDPAEDDKVGTAKPAEAALASAGATAPSLASRATGGGAMSPAAYARAVMKKVRSTKRKSDVGRGTVVIGFTVADDGGLASVQVLQGSGNPGLDTAALDHIRRSAPFPPVPDGVGSSFSFEFVGR